MPGTGHQVIDLEYSKVKRPDIVIIMNKIYKNEIEKRMVEKQVNLEVVLV